MKSAITYRYFRDIKDIKRQWLFLQKQCISVSPFMSYEFMSIAISRLWYYFLFKRAKTLFVLFTEDGDSKPIAIVPLIKLHSGKYELFIHLNGFEYSDILSVDSNVATTCLSILQKDGICFDAYWVRSDSIAFEWMAQNYTKRVQIANVAIRFASHKSWFDGLSKSVRQNIRTSYNRLSRDNHRYHLLVFRGGDKFASRYDNGDYSTSTTGMRKKSLFDKTMSLYFLRHDERYNVSTSLIKRILLRYCHFATSNYENNSQCLTIALFIDDKLAAFSSGVVNLSGDTYVIPRLSINSDLRFFSPGVLLISESIRLFSAMTNIHMYDLGCGEEKYKYDLGGINHFSYHFFQ